LVPFLQMGRWTTQKGRSISLARWSSGGHFKGSVCLKHRIIAFGKKTNPMIDCCWHAPLIDVVDFWSAVSGRSPPFYIGNNTKQRRHADQQEAHSIVRKKVNSKINRRKKEIVEDRARRWKPTSRLTHYRPFYSDFRSDSAGDKDYKSSTRGHKKIELRNFREEKISKLSFLT